MTIAISTSIKENHLALCIQAREKIDSIFVMFLSREATRKDLLSIH